jgi:hypothetical protein
MKNRVQAAKLAVFLDKAKKEVASILKECHKPEDVITHGDWSDASIVSLCEQIVESLEGDMRCLEADVTTDGMFQQDETLEETTDRLVKSGDVTIHLIRR